MSRGGIWGKGLNFSYKTAADWLDWPYNRIPDWLFLNANDDGSNRRTKISWWFQEYESCLSAAIRFKRKLLLFPVDCDTRRFFVVFRVTFLMLRVCFKPINVVHWNAPRVASWLSLYYCTWCYFTTFLSSRGKLTWHFASNKKRAATCTCVAYQIILSTLSAH